MGRRSQRNMPVKASAKDGNDRPASDSASLSGASKLMVVTLTADRLNAKGASCVAGTVISPNVEGWPEHRVNWHLQHGYAQQVVVEAQETSPDVAGPASREAGQLGMEDQALTDQSESAPAAADEPEGE